MKYKKKKPTYKQYAIERKIEVDTRLSNHWLSENGVGVKDLHVGSKEAFQALKMANTAVKQHAYLLSQDQLKYLNQFISEVRCAQKRKTMVLGRCFKVMNIAKQALRKAAKYH